jgi:mannose-1-phosphate guanylyltransferase
MCGKATISLREVEEVSHFGIAEMKGDEIIRFKEKPTPEETFSNLANSGIYILAPEILDMIPLAFYDFSKNLFPRMLEEGKKICGFVTDAFWKDVGKPEDYLEASKYYLKKENKICEGCSICDSDIKESVIGKNCSVTGSKISSSVVFDNTKMGADTIAENCIIGENCVIEGLVELHGAVIGDNVIIGSGATVAAGARIGPNVQIASSSSVSGVILPEDLEDEND